MFYNTLHLEILITVNSSVVAVLYVNSQILLNHVYAYMYIVFNKQSYLFCYTTKYEF